MTCEQERPRVLLLFGGRSGEHSISCATAAGFLRAIDREKWDVLPVGITRDGAWVRVPDEPELFEFRDGHAQEVHAGDTALTVKMVPCRGFLTWLGKSMWVAVLCRLLSAWTNTSRRPCLIMQALMLVAGNW